MTADHGSGELYTGQMIGMLEAVWGEGWLSPGGPEEVGARCRMGSTSPANRFSISAVGWAGSISIWSRTHGAGFVTGIDVEDTVLITARRAGQRQGP